LYRNLGLLYAAKGDYDEALRQLADDVRKMLMLWYCLVAIKSMSQYQTIINDTFSFTTTKYNI